MSYSYNKDYISGQDIVKWFKEGEVRRIFENLDYISRCEEHVNLILNLLFADFDRNKAYIEQMAHFSNLEIRYYFMKYVVTTRPNMLNSFYDDITKFLSFSNEDANGSTLMRSEMICDLAITILNSDLDREIWLSLKEWILKKYERNSLANLLLQPKRRSDTSIAEFLNDSEKLFNSAGTDMLTVFHFCEELGINSPSIVQFREHIKFFEGADNEFSFHLYYIFQWGLWDILIKYIDKYLDISKEKSYAFVASGSTAACYRIGDYIFKLVRYKHSYESSVCPDIFLVHKNLEETYVRNEKDIVKAGIEVQKFLKRKASDVPPEFLACFEQELRNAGFELHDTLVGGDCGDNCMMLDSYLDVNHPNPEALPEWFKTYPIVLIDHDLVYPINLSQAPKQLR